MKVIIRNRRFSESGSALFLSIVVLLILSVIGLGLMLTARTEMDIASNHRWSEMAFFNAEAALELGKNVLAAYAVRDGDFRNAVAPPRGPSEMRRTPNDPAACGEPDAAGCRDYQYFIRRREFTVYIGRVLRDLDGRLLQYDPRKPVAGDTRGDIDGDGAGDISGTVTLWVRRPLSGNEDYGFSDNRHDRVVLTAEGTAPTLTGFDRRRANAVRRLEMTVRILPVRIREELDSNPTAGSDRASNAARADRKAAAVQ